MKVVLTRAAVWCSQGTLGVRWLGLFPSFPVWGCFSFHTCPRDPLFPVLSWLFGAAAHLHPCPNSQALALASSPAASWQQRFPSFFLVSSKRGVDTGENSASLCPRGLSSGDSSVRGWQPLLRRQEWQPCSTHPRVPNARPVHQVVADTGTGFGQHCPGFGKGNKGSGSIPQTSFELWATSV